MSSMVRSIRREMARKDGTFVPQKPLRDRSNISVKAMLLKALRGMHIQNKAIGENKEDKGCLRLKNK